MKSSVLQHFPFIWMTCTGLVIFVTIYALVLVRVYRPKNKKMYQAIASLPLDIEGDR